MHRVPLDELCLQIKLLDLGDVAEFLGKAIEPPKEEAVAKTTWLFMHWSGTECLRAA